VPACNRHHNLWDEKTMPHIVLLGDSIFDNAAYVPGELPVIEQLRARLPEN
jgi:hypothetical protein